MVNCKKRIIVIIPAYNEGSNIAEVIQRLHTCVPDVDILVINDGSIDRTARIVKESGAMVVSHPFNMGYGVTIQTGYKYAVEHGYDFLVQIDGDGQHDPACIPGLLEPLLAGEADFVLGSRFLDGKSYEPSLIRRLGMGFFRTLVCFVTGLPITDCTSGFQAFNRDVIRFFTRDIFPVDYPDADVLITLHRADFRIRELPVRMYAAEGKSMHSGIKPLYYIFKMVLSIFVTLMRSKNLYAGGR